MATQTMKVKGYIKDGKLEVELPENVPDGEVEVTIPVAPTADDEIPWEERPWTDEELAEFFEFKGKTLGEILDSGLVGSWSDMGIEDSVEWVEEVRRKEKERRGW